MIVAEAFTYTIIGGIVGTILGLLSNKVLFEMLISYKWGDTWTIPLKELGIILLIVVLSAIVAVYGPIKRICPLLTQSAHSDSTFEVGGFRSHPLLSYKFVS